eukprot:COSAG01_NODE_6970_length_3411_cov_3.486715_5_plen_386_part_00
MMQQRGGEAEPELEKEVEEQQSSDEDEAAPLVGRPRRNDGGGGVLPCGEAEEAEEEPPLPSCAAEVWDLLQLSVPIFVSRVSGTAKAITDTALLGHIDTDSRFLLASALSDMWTQSTGVFMQGRVLGIFCGQAFGANNKQLAGIWLQVSLAVVSVIAVPVAVLWLSCHWVLRSVAGQPEQISSDASYYAAVRSPCRQCDSVRVLLLLLLLLLPGAPHVVSRWSVVGPSLTSWAARGGQTTQWPWSQHMTGHGAGHPCPPGIHTSLAVLAGAADHATVRAALGDVLPAQPGGGAVLRAGDPGRLGVARAGLRGLPGRDGQLRVHPARGAAAGLLPWEGSAPRVLARRRLVVRTPDPSAVRQALRPCPPAPLPACLPPWLPGCRSYR